MYVPVVECVVIVGGGCGEEGGTIFFGDQG